MNIKLCTTVTFPKDVSETIKNKYVSEIYEDLVQQIISSTAHFHSKIDVNKYKTFEVENQYSVVVIIVVNVDTNQTVVEYLSDTDNKMWNVYEEESDA